MRPLTAHTKARQDAQAAGEDVFNGRVCKRCRGTEFYTQANSCVSCMQERNRNAAAAQKRVEFNLHEAIAKHRENPMYQPWGSA